MSDLQSWAWTPPALGVYAVTLTVVEDASCGFFGHGVELFKLFFRYCERSSSNTVLLKIKRHERPHVQVVPLHVPPIGSDITFRALKVSSFNDGPLKFEWSLGQEVVGTGDSYTLQAASLPKEPRQQNLRLVARDSWGKPSEAILRTIEPNSAEVLKKTATPATPMGSDSIPLPGGQINGKGEILSGEMVVREGQILEFADITADNLRVIALKREDVLAGQDGAPGSNGSPGASAGADGSPGGTGNPGGGGRSGANAWKIVIKGERLAGRLVIDASGQQGGAGGRGGTGGTGGAGARGESAAAGLLDCKRGPGRGGNGGAGGDGGSGGNGGSGGDAGDVEVYFASVAPGSTIQVIAKGGSGGIPGQGGGGGIGGSGGPEGPTSGLCRSAGRTGSQGPTGRAGSSGYAGQAGRLGSITLTLGNTALQTETRTATGEYLYTARD